MKFTSHLKFFKMIKKEFSSGLNIPSKRVMMVLVEGNEEIETVTISNVLTRANNYVNLCKVNFNGDNHREIRLARGLKIVADSFFEEEDHKDYDILILPGGKLGAENYDKSQKLKDSLMERKNSKMLYASICATPALFMAKNKLLLNKATCYPAFIDNLTVSGYEYKSAPYVIDEYSITGRSPGDAMAFSIKLVDILNGLEKAIEVSHALQF